MAPAPASQAPIADYGHRSARAGRDHTPVEGSHAVERGAFARARATYEFYRATAIMNAGAEPWRGYTIDSGQNRS
jgi:hypothetical protein